MRIGLDVRERDFTRHGAALGGESGVVSRWVRGIRATHHRKRIVFGFLARSRRDERARARHRRRIVRRDVTFRLSGFRRLALAASRSSGSSRGTRALGVRRLRRTSRPTLYATTSRVVRRAVGDVARVDQESDDFSATPDVRGVRARVVRESRRG